MQSVYSTIHSRLGHQVCVDTGCSLKDLLNTIDDRDEQREREREREREKSEKSVHLA